MKKIAIIWSISIVIIVGGLTIYGLFYKKNNIGNLSEEALVKQAEKYLGTYPAKFPLKGDLIKLTNEFLKDEGYNAELETDCSGYVVVKNEDMGYKYNAYVKCPDYVTKGYSQE